MRGDEDLHGVIKIRKGKIGGKRDEHLVPGEGAIDWEGVLMAFQKVGYDGAWIFELAPSAEPAAVLARASRAREMFERLLRFEQ